MIPIIPIQTDLLSIVGVTVGAFVFGVVVAWLLKPKGGGPRLAVQGSEPEGMFLIFSRISHRLKTVGEVIRGHLHGFSDELPADAERWRVARRAIADEASGIDSLVNRLD
ncbi:MAG: hypothetical protein ACE5Q6_03335, partial [Dehalococcoidia bacterium]